MDLDPKLKLLDLNWTTHDSGSYVKLDSNRLHLHGFEIKARVNDEDGEFWHMEVGDEAMVNCEVEGPRISFILINDRESIDHWECSRYCSTVWASLVSGGIDQVKETKLEQ